MDDIVERLDEKLTVVGEKGTLEGNWNGFASRFQRGLENLESAVDMIIGDKKWYGKLDKLLTSLDKLGEEMEKYMINKQKEQRKKNVGLVKKGMRK